MVSLSYIIVNTMCKGDKLMMIIIIIIMIMIMIIIIIILKAIN